MEIIFWLSIGTIMYVYVGYLIVLRVIKCFKSFLTNKYTLINKDLNEYFSVSIIIPAYNEENFIRKRIENLLSLEYPKEKLEIIIASDGSTDRTNEIVSQYTKKGINLFAQKERRGKSCTQNNVIKTAKGDVIIFSDVDTLFALDFVKKVVRGFADPKVGCIAGECTYVKDDCNVTTESLGIFWRLELVLRRLESQIGALFTVSGACMAVRKELYRDMEGKYGDDCVIPLDVLLQGYRVVVESEAKAYVRNVSSPKAEFNARVRMTLRNLTGTLSRIEIFNPFKYPTIVFAIFSHKLLRWFTPFFLLSAFFSNMLILDNLNYKIMVFLQSTFYILAMVGFYMGEKEIRIKFISMPFSFCIANLGIMLGVLKALFGKRIESYQNR